MGPNKDWRIGILVERVECVSVCTVGWLDFGSFLVMVFTMTRFWERMAANLQPKNSFFLCVCCVQFTNHKEIVEKNQWQKQTVTPWKTSMDPENHWFKGKQPFRVLFSGFMLVFGSVPCRTYAGSVR